jgi:transposase-like protein
MIKQKRTWQEIKVAIGNFKIVLDAFNTDKAVAEVARNCDVHPNTVRNWIERFEENDHGKSLTVKISE